MSHPEVFVDRARFERSARSLCAIVLPAAAGTLSIAGGLAWAGRSGAIDALWPLRFVLLVAIGGIVLGALLPSRTSARSVVPRRKGELRPFAPPRDKRCGSVAISATTQRDIGNHDG